MYPRLISKLRLLCFGLVSAGYGMHHRTKLFQSVRKRMPQSQHLRGAIKAASDPRPASSAEFQADGLTPRHTIAGEALGHLWQPQEAMPEACQHAVCFNRKMAEPLAAVSGSPARQTCYWPWHSWLLGKPRVLVGSLEGR